MTGEDRNSIGDQGHLAEIIESARIGTWEWDVQTGEIVFNRLWAAFLGYNPPRTATDEF